MPMRFYLAAAVACAASVAYCNAAQAQDASGDWHGAVTGPAGATLRIGVTFTPKGGGAYDGTMTSPDQTPDAFPLDEAKVEGGTLTFTFAAIRGSYTGHWDQARKAWVGQWTQGVPLPLVLTAGKP